MSCFLLALLASLSVAATDPLATFDLDLDAGRVVRRDATGKVVWSMPLKGYLGSGRPPHLLWDARRVYVTHADGVTALDVKTGKVLWHSKGPPLNATGMDSGGLYRLPGGDLVAFSFGCIHDSGVLVARLNARTGKVVWQTFCAPLGVSHSKYRHRADLAIAGGRVTVTSRASFGTFVETLDLRSGIKQKRTRFGPGEYPGDRSH